MPLRLRIEPGSGTRPRSTPEIASPPAARPIHQQTAAQERDRRASAGPPAGKPVRYMGTTGRLDHPTILPVGRRVHDRRFRLAAGVHPVFDGRIPTRSSRKMTVTRESLTLSPPLYSM